MKTLVSGISSKVNIATHILWGTLKSESTKCMSQTTVIHYFVFVIRHNDAIGRNSVSQVSLTAMGRGTVVVGM